MSSAEHQPSLPKSAAWGATTPAPPADATTGTTTYAAVTTAAATPAKAAAVVEAKKAVLTRERCVDHVKQLVELNKFDITLGDETFQDTVKGVWYRKQVIRDAFSEIASGNGSAGLPAPTEAEIRAYCREFVARHKLGTASLQKTQDTEGMWLRKAAIRAFSF